MSNFYKVNFKKLAVMLLPTFLRQRKMIAWLKVLVTPLQELYEDFLQKRRYDLYRLNHTGQVFSLRKVLNDEFDNELRRIKIVDAPEMEPQYIYTEAEQQPVYLEDPLYLYQDENYAYTGVDFIVLIPFEVWNIQKTEVQIGEYRFYKIEALVDFFRLASKKYTIQIL